MDPTWLSLEKPEPKARVEPNFFCSARLNSLTSLGSYEPCCVMARATQCKGAVSHAVCRAVHTAQLILSCHNINLFFIKSTHTITSVFKSFYLIFLIIFINTNRENCNCTQSVLGHPSYILKRKA